MNDTLPEVHQGYEQPPQLANVEAEAALLGALMGANNLIDPIAEKLRREHFHEEIHGRIFEAILREHSLQRTATPVTLRQYFVDDPLMQQVGGPGYLAQLTGSGAGVLGARDFAEQIRDLAMRRTMVAELEETRKALLDYDRPIEEASTIVEAALAAAQDDAGSGSVEVSAAAAATAHLERIEKGLPPGVTCGIEPIDLAIGPIRPGDLVILAGRPGMFKTGTALNYARGVADGGDAPLLNTDDDGHRERHGVLFVSYEMTAEQLGMRLLADACFNGRQGVPFAGIENGSLSRDAWREVARARDRLEELPLQIADLASGTPAKLNRLVARWKRRFAARGVKLALVVVDYLQLMDGDKATDNRTSEITQISRGLKMCAKANGVGVLALSQLSRKVEERDEKRPRLADLRESGSIEQDADTVLFLYRQEYYLRQNEPPEGHERRERWEAALAACEGDIEFICAKRRQGQSGIRHGRFYGHFQAVRAL